MLRKDREITDPAEILAVLRRCDTVRLGLRGEEYPYVVPVSFGLAEEDGRPVLYFHGARAGLKTALLKARPEVCVEADRLLRYERTAHGITARCESVIGFGRAVPVEGAEKLAGLRAINEHCGFPDYPVESCASLAGTAVYKIALVSLTGKRNPPAP